MPLWRIYAHPSTFTVEQKQGLAKAITKLYTDAPLSLPAFYVIVFFVPMEEENLYFGGVTNKNFVRICTEQIARQMPDPVTAEGRAHRAAWMDKINAALKPFIADRPELDWENHIAETPRDLWRVQGLEPPAPWSEEEKVWVKENKASPWKQV